MRRALLIVLRSPQLRWDSLVEKLPPVLESMGLAPDESGSDGKLVVLDHGEAGCVIEMDSSALSKRVATALARQTGATIDVYEVSGTAGTKRNRFRTSALRATPAGELKPHDGRELDLEDDTQTWGGGGLDAQALRVMQEYASLDLSAQKTFEIGYKKAPKGRPSTPRVATLLKSLQKSKTYAFTPLPDGRVELKLELATAGKQTSFVTEAEHQELLKLLT